MRFLVKHKKHLDLLSKNSDVIIVKQSVIPQSNPMARKRRTELQPIGVGMTAKQMKRRKPINTEFLLDIEPLTDNQATLFDSFSADKNLVAYGAAGTGKTFITFYNALKDVLDENTPYEKTTLFVL